MQRKGSIEVIKKYYIVRILIVLTIAACSFGCKDSSTNSSTSEYDKYLNQTSDTGVSKKGGGPYLSETYDPKTYESKSASEIVDDVMRDIMFDTLGMKNAPVKVLKAILYREPYSTYKDISLTYQNVSSKKIEAIKFKWYGEDAFGEPADMGGYTTEGFGGGFDDHGLSPGKKKTSSWSILSSRGKKVVLAWPYEVVFSDGSKWKTN